MGLSQAVRCRRQEKVTTQSAHAFFERFPRLIKQGGHCHWRVAAMIEKGYGPLVKGSAPCTQKTISRRQRARLLVTCADSATRDCHSRTTTWGSLTCSGPKQVELI
jgi:hypothetical protein